MFRADESKLIEVKPAPLKRSKSTKRERTKLIICALFGLWAALLWHFIHLADEPYLASFTNIHFWLHLFFEGFLALYVAGFLYVCQRSIRRKRIQPGAD